jgi:hypothetical protein
MTGYDEQQNFLSLGTARGWLWFSRAQSEGAFGGLLVGLVLLARFGASLSMLVIVSALIITGIILRTRWLGLPLWRQGWHILRYLVRQRRHAAQPILIDGVTAVARPAVTAELLRDGIVVWSVSQPGTEE